MKFGRFVLLGVAGSFAAAGVAYGMSQGNGNGPPSRIAYLHVANDGSVDLAHTSPGVTVSNGACVSADFPIKGGSVVAGPDTSGVPVGFALNGAPDAPPNAFGPGSVCGDAQAFIDRRGEGVYVTLVG
jgi:hypothetical protein